MLSISWGDVALDTEAYILAEGLDFMMCYATPCSCTRSYEHITSADTPLALDTPFGV